MFGSRIYLLVTLLVVSAFAKVVELNDITFAENIIDSSSSDLWFVKFYQPWCGFCTRMQPEWEQADAQFHANADTNQQGLKVHFSQLDCGTSPKACDRLVIPGYPKLTLFTNGTMYDFPRDLDRTADNFVKFVNDGYLQQSPLPIPSGVYWLESIRQEVENMWHNFKFILFRYPEVASCFMALGTFVGIATTSLAFMFTMTTSPGVKDKVQ